MEESFLFSTLSALDSYPHDAVKAVNYFLCTTQRIRVKWKFYSNLLKCLFGLDKNTFFYASRCFVSFCHTVCPLAPDPVVSQPGRRAAAVYPSQCPLVWTQEGSNGQLILSISLQRQSSLPEWISPVDRNSHQFQFCVQFLEYVSVVFLFFTLKSFLIIKITIKCLFKKKNWLS